MSVIKVAKDLVKGTPLAVPFIYLKGKFNKPHSQNEEANILEKILSRFEVPKMFVEFGFGGWEFNCASLAYEWDGLLLDGDQYNITVSRTILPKSITSERAWITLDNLDIIRRYVDNRDLGILSIDVDGNDYWFLRELIALHPSIIISEYNSSFGLRPISVPYDPNFDYREKNPSYHAYYGASLAAITWLAKQHNYSLIEVGNSGINAFFVRNDLLGPDDRPLDADQAYRERLFWDRSRPSEQWAKISHLPYVDVTLDSPFPQATA